MNEDSEKEVGMEPEYELLLQERNMLIDAERESVRSFDKALLTLASGAFGLSITFLSSLAPKDSEAKWLLVLSWSFFALSLVSVLVSFLLSQSAIRREIINRDRDFVESKKAAEGKDQVETPQRGNKLTTATVVMNYFSIGLFISGVIALGIFSSINLYKGAG